MVSRHRESGAVSLFLVIFAMLLITVVTLSFVRVTVKDQAASSVADLSQSAYDSALAGTEDAKRALIYYRTLCSNDATQCAAQAAVINSTSCNGGLKSVTGVDPNQEVLIQQSQSSSDPKTNLNQAYTCVTMNLETPDYLGTADANTSRLIPLKTTGNITSVTVEWYLPSDLGTTSSAVNLLGGPGSATPLYRKNSTTWPSNRPSLMRIQLMQVGANFSLTDFDNSVTTGGVTASNADTAFLYPTSRNVPNTIDLSSVDVRKSPTRSPTPVQCSTNISGGGYACSTTINLPPAIGQSNSDRTAYLRLTPLYNGAHFRISLGGAAQFDAVQPSIDSTGRANTQYRRVSSRVDLVNTSFPFPEAAVDLTGNLCKDFLVTDNTDDFVDNNCTP